MSNRSVIIYSCNSDGSTLAKCAISVTAQPLHVRTCTIWRHRVGLRDLYEHVIELLAIVTNV